MSNALLPDAAIGSLSSLKDDTEDLSPCCMAAEQPGFRCSGPAHPQPGRENLLIHCQQVPLCQATRQKEDTRVWLGSVADPFRDSGGGPQALQEVREGVPVVKHEVPPCAGR